VFSHLFIGTDDFAAAMAFYRPVLAVLDIEPRFVDDTRPWAGWQSRPGPRPLLLIGRPFDGQPHVPGNGQMVALLAPSRAAVDRAHATALAHGGHCDGPPGLRPEYHPSYYGAYFRDPAGNKLCVVCHEPEAPPA
jgi:lactoylglutathione lyase